jgi:hypothetical protein
MLEKPQIRSGARRRVSGAERDHGEKEALRIVEEGCQTLGLSAGASGLDKLKKTDPRKVQLAILLRSHTSVSNAWIAERLAMGHPGSVSRSVSVGRSMKETVKDTLKLGKMLKCVL